MYLPLCMISVQKADACVADVKGQDCDFVLPTSREKVIPTLIFNKHKFVRSRHDFGKHRQCNAGIKLIWRHHSVDLVKNTYFFYLISATKISTQNPVS